MFRCPKSVKLMAAFLLVAASTSASATVVNGDFASGLNDWEAEGLVSSAGEVAIINDDFPLSGLFQVVNTGQGMFLFEFDFLANFSSDLTADPFAFPDTLWVSLYLTDDPTGTIQDDYREVFDMDDSGIFALYPGVSVGASALGGDWLHASLTFTNDYQYAMPAFELADFNFVIGDSEVQIDNVSITPAQAPIPEPTTVALMALGLAGLLARGRNLTPNHR